MARRTLAQSARVSGIGLHTGSSVSAICQGAPSGQGIVFRRTDLPGTPVIPARLSEVQSTERRTVLGLGETVVQTVEHVLAADRRASDRRPHHRHRWPRATDR